MEPRLTPGIVAELCTGNYDGREFVIQVTACKNVNGRYRVLMHDGVHSSSNAMLNSTYNQVVDNDEIRPNTILRVTRCNATEAPGAGGTKKYFAVLVEVEILKQCESRIGNPTKFADSADNASSTPANPSAREPVAPRSDYMAPRTTNTAAKPPPPRPSKENNNGHARPNVHPIKALNPYQNKWMIKARVVVKNDKRTWSNARGEGTLFSFEIQDESSTMKVTAFKEECTKFFDVIKEGKVYYIQKGTLKPKDSRFNKTDAQYELTLQRESIVELCEDDRDLPKIRFDFRSISEIETIDVGEVIDVVGVVKLCGEVATLISRKDSRELTKRDLQIVDRSKKMVSLTLWGQQAIDFPSELNRSVVLAARGVRIGDFQGKNLSTLQSSKLFLDDPEIDEVNQLRGWWENEGVHAQDFSSLSTGSSRKDGDIGSNWKCFKQTTLEKLGRGEKPDYYSVKASVVFTKKDNALYPACNQEKCNKKVNDLGSGKWRCEKCQKEIDNFKWRMMLQVNLADFSDNCWATLFQESGEVLLNVSADQLGKLKEDNPTEYDNVIADVNFKPFTFRMRAKEETYNDEARLKTTVYEAKKFEPVAYGNVVLKQIEELAEKMGI